MTLAELKLRQDIIKGVAAKFQYDITDLQDEIMRKKAMLDTTRKWKDHYESEASLIDKAIQQHPENATPN